VIRVLHFAHSPKLFRPKRDLLFSFCHQ
jgi:hypothetical protein